MSQENLFCLHAMEMGICLAFVYDLFRLFRRVIPHGTIWVSAEDLLYWVFCGGEVFWFLQRENNGLLRWYAVFAAVAGIWAYLKLASPPFLKYGSLLMKKTLTRLAGAIKIIAKGVIIHGRKIFKRKIRPRDGGQGKYKKKKKEGSLS